MNRIQKLWAGAGLAAMSFAASAATAIDVSTVSTSVIAEVKDYATGVGPAIVGVAVVMIGIKYGKKLLGKI